MKCVMIFLVLTLVVLMAEPGEGFIYDIFHRIAKVGKSIGYFPDRRGMTEQQELDRQEQAAFD